MRRIVSGVAIAVWACLATTAAAQGNPEETVRLADQVLHEIMVIPARQIPAQMLADAQAVAIIPSVIKIGFIGGIRHGRGVILVRGEDGDWNLPQFISITGGSIGWQAGAQATDVILVFRTRAGVDSLMNGKFTIGVDAAAAAGPVGRRVEAATDGQLRAEILSYSRSRGLFAGVSLDGSALQPDVNSHLAFYGALPSQPPVRVPESALRLVQNLSAYARPGIDAVGGPLPGPVAPAVRQLDVLRGTLAQNASQLYGLLDEPWRQFLAVPPELFNTQTPAAPAPEALELSLLRFAQVSADPQFAALNSRPEFQATHELLIAYQQLRAAQNPLALPPPPAGMPPSAAPQ